MTPNPLPPPAALPAPKPNRTPWLVALLAVVAMCCCGVPMAFAAWTATLPESGVLAGNQVDEKTRRLINKRISLSPDEELVSYYDATLAVDGSECSLLTTKRLVTWKGTTLSEMSKDEVVEITWAQEPLAGDIITVSDDTGRALVVEVAPMNDGAAFVKALERVTGLEVASPTSARRARSKPSAAPAPTDEKAPVEPEPAEHRAAPRKRRQ